MARGFLDSLDKRLIAFLYGLFERGGSPERLARGFASGLLGVFFPTHGLRFVSAFIGALFFRGNKATALLVPALLIWFDLRVTTQIEGSMAAWAWPSRADDIQAAVSAFNGADLAGGWLHPLDALLNQWAVLSALPLGVGLALGLAALLLGLVAGVALYPVALITLSFFYDAKYRTQIFLEWRKRKPQTAFVLPAVAASPANVTRDMLREKYCGRKYVFTICDAVRLLIDGGQAYPEMLAAIASAHKTLVLETYILRDDKFGKLFAEALKLAARRGVRTRVICDGVGSIGLPIEFKAALVEAGVELRIFHPLSSFWRGGFGFLQRRDHRKIIVADTHVSLIGGLNIADEYAAVADGGGGWRDTHIRIDGVPAATILTKIFEETWHKAEPVHARHGKHAIDATSSYDLPSIANEDWSFKSRADIPVHHTSEQLSMLILSNHELIARLRIKRAYLRAFRAAESYILIENAFFIPDRDVLRTLYAAVKRGVKVAVVVAMRHDIRVAAMAARALYDELLSNGVRLFEYPISMIHSKVAAIDDRWSIVSSYNLNHRSLLHDLEVGALFFDERFTQALRDQILLDIEKCNELTIEIHRSRSWNIALTESVCYQFRYWL